MKAIRIGSHTLDVLEHPEGVIAHPGERWHARARICCQGCLLAVRRDTGELVLLWRSGDNFNLSRRTPHYKRHRKEMEAAP